MRWLWMLVAVEALAMVGAAAHQLAATHILVLSATLVPIVWLSAREVGRAGRRIVSAQEAAEQALHGPARMGCPPPK